MIVTKNQIRPRRETFHFSNAEILLWDTAGGMAISNPGPLGVAVVLDQVEIQANIVVPYTNIDATAAMLFDSDFAFCFFLESVGGVISTMLGTTNLTMGQSSSSQGYTGSFGTVGGQDATNYTDFADLASIGGLRFAFANGAAGDLTGGDPANFVNLTISYHLYNLEPLS